MRRPTPRDASELEFLSEQENSLIAALIDQAIENGSAENRVLVQRPHSTCQNPRYHHYRVECVSDENRLAFIVYKNHHIHFLMSYDVDVLRRYIALSHQFPVHLSGRSHTGIILAAMIKHRVYQPIVEEGILAKWGGFIHALAELESFINRFTLGISIQEHIERICQKLMTLKEVLPPHLQIRIDEFQKQLSVELTEAELDSLLSTIPLKRTAAITMTLADFIRELIQKYVDYSRVFFHEAWGHSWEQVARQIQYDLVKLNVFLNYGHVPKAQLEFIKMLVTPLEKVENTSLVVLKQEPKIQDILFFMRAVNGDDVQEQALHVHWLKDLMRFFGVVVFQDILLTLQRSISAGFDVIQGLWYTAFCQQLPHYYSSVREGELLSYQILAYAHLLPEESVLKDSVLPSSARLVEYMRTVIQLKKMMEYLWLSGQTLIYGLFLPFIATGRVFSSLKIQWLSRDEDFEQSISEAMVNECAAGLTKNIKKRCESLRLILDLLKNEGFSASLCDLEKFLDYVENIRLEKDSRPVEKLMHLSRLHFCFEIIYAATVKTEQLQPEPWHQEAIEGITTFFPAEITESLVHYLVNNVLIEQRASAEIAFACAILGLSAPYFREGTEAINKLLTGKSLKSAGLMNLGVMGFIGYKGALAIATALSKEESILYEVIHLLKQDPLKNVGGVTLLVLLGLAHVTAPYIAALKFLSCDLKISKLGLLWVFEQCLKEAFEALKLAKFPYFELLLIVFKELGILQSMVVQDGLPTFSYVGDPQKLQIILNEIISLMINCNYNIPRKEAYQSDVKNIISQLEEKLKRVNSPVHSDALPLQLNVRDRILMMQTMQQFGKDQLYEGDRKKWFKDLADHIHASQMSPYSKAQSLQALYRIFVETPRSRLSNFLYHGIHSMYFMLAYLLTGIPDATRAVCNFREQYPDIIRYLGNAAFVSTFSWWVFIYDSSAAVPPHECLDTTLCLNLGDEDHELIEECMQVLTRCSCVPYEGYHVYFALLTMGIKYLGGLSTVIGSIFSCIQWNTEESRQHRKATRAYWAQDAIRLLNGTFLYAAYAFFMHAAALLDDMKIFSGLRAVYRALANTCCYLIFCRPCQSQPEHAIELNDPEAEMPCANAAEYQRESDLESLLQSGVCAVARSVHSVFASRRPEVTQNGQLMLDLTPAQENGL